ncbi:MAG: DUF1624 domain-containing protein [Acidobacteria bacterium]|nr:DUF1624 domain-containing protein [Acidobacteriota bacterium]MBU4307152.1 DUF1624 domain-containing protein [Acidobacteriota bacterium]MCG2812674.1 heparan-alpha-glucosaminide N-acetyltransferase domain-containing protein [Candidatus Aminicenantes bacterium]
MKWIDWKSEDAGLIRRVDALDLFRFFVLFFMIQGHLFRAYLMPAIRQEYWYKIHEVLHGFVAPGFLFAAGFAAFLSFHNKRQNYIHLDRAFFKRLRRILFVIAVGYWIHLPLLSLRKTIRFLRMGKADDFLRVDILQCIGVALLFFTLLAVLLKNEKIVVLFSALAGVLFFLLPETVKGIRLHAVIDPYLRYDISMFPIFPWAGFLCIGIVTAYIFSLLKKEVFFKLLLLSGILIFPWFFILSGKLHFKTALTLIGNLNKAAGIFLLLWISYWLLRRFDGRFLRLLKRAGTESLFVYVLHLFIIFNSIFRPGLKALFQNSLNVLQALFLFFIVQLVVFAASLLYNYMKEKQPFWWRLGFNAFWLIFFVIFAIKPH